MGRQVGVMFLHNTFPRSAILSETNVVPVPKMEEETEMGRMKKKTRKKAEPER